jgi:hypothetical protein
VKQRFFGKEIIYIICLIPNVFVVVVAAAAAATVVVEDYVIWNYFYRQRFDNYFHHLC